MRFVCASCGHDFKGEHRPQVCPACSADGANLWTLDDDASAIAPVRVETRRVGVLFVRCLAIAGLLCLIPTPLIDELMRVPKVVVGNTASEDALRDSDRAGNRQRGAAPVGGVGDRRSPGTVAVWRNDADPRGAVASRGQLAGGRAATPRPVTGPPHAEIDVREAPPGAPSGQGAGSEGAGSEDVVRLDDRCPGGRAPPSSVVFIVDASVSMGLPADTPVALERELDARMDAGDARARTEYRMLIAQPAPKRLDVAKAIFMAATESLPGDLDTGLVTFRSCTGIAALGPVGPDGIGELTRHVDALAVERGGETAITDSLTRARAMVGPGGGRLVVITDGQETCSANPCAVHGDIAEHGIVVDVLDLTGQAALGCLADRSGGQVYRADDDLDVAALVAFVRAAIAPAPLAVGCGEAARRTPPHAVSGR